MSNILSQALLKPEAAVGTKTVCLVCFLAAFAVLLKLFLLVQGCTEFGICKKVLNRKMRSSIYALRCAWWRTSHNINFSLCIYAFCCGISTFKATYI